MKREVVLNHHSRELAEFRHIRMLGHQVVRKLDAGTLPRHLNPGIEICYIHKGRFDWTVEGRLVSALPGITTMTLPWQEHGGAREVMDIGELSWIIIHPDKFTRSGGFSLGAWASLPMAEQAYIASQLLAAPAPVVVAKHVASRGFFEAILLEIGGHSPGRTWRVNRLLEDLLLSLARALDRATQVTQRDSCDVGFIRQAVRTDPGRKWTLAELCALSGWSKSALNPRVKDATGYSIMEYVMMLRLEIAKERLIQADQSITEIALDLGFFSSQHFAMVFRQRMGTTPSAYRRAGMTAVR